ncbi:MAG: hypothetical protein P1U63_07025 [Coxiellaceae bacterium]|nr:hypothetical protein [Coxiellaceae bacterium]
MWQEYLQKETKPKPTVSDIFNERRRQYKLAMLAKLREVARRDTRYSTDPDTIKDRKAAKLLSQLLTENQINDAHKATKQRLSDNIRKPQYKKACRLINQAFRNKTIDAKRRKDLFSALNYCYEMTNGNPLKFITVRLNPNYTPFPHRPRSTTTTTIEASESKQTSSHPRTQSEPRPKTVPAEHTQPTAAYSQRYRRSFLYGKKPFDDRKSPLAQALEAGADKLSEFRFKPI